MAKKIKSGGGGTQASSMMPGRYAPGYTPVDVPDHPIDRMTPGEIKRARKQAKADHKAAFDAGQMKTANELTKRMKQLKSYA